jgi:hypothetical protein
MMTTAAYQPLIYVAEDALDCVGQLKIKAVGSAKPV